MDKEDIIKQCISDYISARKRLLEIGNLYPELIGGNDNVIGRIGEFYGILYLRSIGQFPKKVFNLNNQGFDLIDSNTEIKTQIKVITSENKNGKSVRLEEPWDQFLLFLLNEDYNIEKIGYINKECFNKAIKENPTLSNKPIVKKTMLGSRGLIGRYGKVIPE